MLTDQSRQRDFPTLAGMTYLNTAAEGIPPQVVIKALAQYSQDKLLGMDGRALHEIQWNGVRQQAATAFGLEPDEIGICSCSSEAFNLAALALRLREGDEVIINDLDFPAGATPWQLPGSPATVRLWRSRNGMLHNEDLAALLNSRTRLVTTSMVSFYNGFRVDLSAIADVVRRQSPALIAVDVTQALGRVPLNLAEADLMISSTHKWLLATHGGGLIGVPKSRAAQWTVPAGGWFNLVNAFDANRFEVVPTPKSGAASFCVGMPNYPAVYAIHAALNYIQQITVQAIEAHTAPLVQACLDGLKKLDVDLLTPQQPGALAGIIAFRHPRAEKIHCQLKQRDIHVMCHAGRLRVALHGYNTMSDVEWFLKALHSILPHV
jgi:cysteine desulfurase / selenocysteine lyase